MFKRGAAVISVLSMLGLGCTGYLGDDGESEGADPETTEAAPIADGQITQAIRDNARVRVIISLKEPFGGMDMAQMQESVVQSMGADWTPRHRFQYTPALAGHLMSSRFADLTKHPYVQSVQLDQPTKAHLFEAKRLIGVDRVQNTRGLTGKGITVGILDSGVATKHPVFQGAIVAQKCFTEGDCADNNANVSDSAEDNNGHGTNVSGIVASRGGFKNIQRGVAPGAKIAVARALDRNGFGLSSDLIAGLEFLFSKQKALNIRVVNMSVGTFATFRNAAECDAQNPALRAIVRRFTDAGVAFFASSGNDANLTSMSAPACLSGAIAVGATFDANLGRQDLFSNVCTDDTTAPKQLTCFTNRGGRRLDILAPGAVIDSAGLDNGTSSFSGTSQASPMAAGVATLMVECNPRLNGKQILNIMKDTGESIADPLTGRRFPLIRAVEAVNRACPVRR